MADPILVEATRGAQVESRHRGAVAVTDAAGAVVMAWGDIEQPVYPRSAIKPLQALPLVESGAADRFGLGTEALALACASHRGEPAHLGVLRDWMARTSLGVADLECGAHPPGDPAAAAALIRTGETPSALHNNCSGKHTGFLTTARHLGEPLRGYIDAAHPVQQRVLATLEAMSGVDLGAAPRGIDGCGIPVIGVPLRALARATARLVDRSELPPARAAAAQRLTEAMAAAPLMVSGTSGVDTALLRLAGDVLRPKGGAEGVCCAALPRQGYGIALKVEDGGGRAVYVVLGAVLARLGILDPHQTAALAEHFSPPIRNVAGSIVGSLRPGPAFASAARSR
jgi:L-asparaginase II